MTVEPPRTGTTTDPTVQSDIPDPTTGIIDIVDLVNGVDPDLEPPF
ncbi:MAG: hypothetical protein LBV30_06170 [Propionibacteriaceae bacterium]|nr:hypothetical protein [Propionibacteriaceae bacterium]